MIETDEPSATAYRMPVESTAVVARVRVYPFKSLDGADVVAADLTPRGGLRWDRTFAFVEGDGELLTAKREPLVHRMRITYDAHAATAEARSETTGEACTFAVADPPAAFTELVGRHVGRSLALQREDDGGFPDDRLAPGPTIVSTATLAAIASWFDGLTVDDVRERLRTNIEIDGVPAFWEDQLFGADGEARPFRIGAVALGGTNPCARCIVPSRDARTGTPLSVFQKRVSERRAATLPPWADASRFDHFYRLTVNTKTLVPGGTIRVGDPVALAA